MKPGVSTQSKLVPSKSTPMSPDATAYLNSALDVMQNNSFYRKQINWTQFRAAAIANGEALKAQIPAQTYPAIRTALTALGDHHSFFQAPTPGTVFSRGAGGASVRMRKPSQDTGE